MFTVVVTTLDGRPTELTPQQQSVKFTTAAVGGFGQCTFTLFGDRRRDVPKLATVRVMYGTQLAWEGRVEDHGIAPADDPVLTTVTCFGLQRRLSDVSVRRIWSKRDLIWASATEASAGGAQRTTGLQVATGQFDTTDLTRFGMQISGTGAAIATLGGLWATTRFPPGLALVRAMFTFTLTGANTGVGKLIGGVQGLDSAGSVVTGLDISASGAQNIAYGANVNQMRAYAYNSGVGALTPTFADVVQYENIRLLGTAVTEDAAGGFYGGTILTDLLALIPGLSMGIIEAGSDYTIAAIERAIRDTSLSVVTEIASYYNREWAVWENGQFSWTTPNLDEPQWIIPVEQMLPGTHIETSIDTLASQVYVLFAEALDGTTAEQAAPASDARNQLVKASVTKDELLQAPAVMTDNTASQLATIEAARQVYAPATGTLVLSATALIQNAVGAAQPAALIRAGRNVYLPGLPKTDSVLAPPARDGETLFHIAETELDMETGTITLSLEGQAREIDVITARLAAATRVVTG